jgi:3-deoxy-7-phosphoheptulonate synthase
MAQRKDMNKQDWTKDSWRSFPIKQQPPWPDMQEYEDTLKTLSSLPALVFAGETRSLKKDLAEAAYGNAFVLQSGDCAEEFRGCNGPRIHALIKVILQMSIVLAYAGEKRVINIGRMAGQHAKPRSSPTEKVGDQVIPSYFGDMVNSPEPTLEARIPRPARILEAYFRATATLNLVRAFTKGGYAALDMVELWHREFLDSFDVNPRYEQLVKGLKKALAFTTAIGLAPHAPQLNQTVLYTSHEALILGYEESLTRIDTTTGDWYDTSGHMLWIGARTRQLEGAHVEFLRGVRNPLGIKIGPDYEIDEIKKIVERLNPENEPGRLSMITRFGADRIEKYLPGLVREMKGEGFNIVWICDAMHGNTYTDGFSRKTRRFDDILSEIRLFFKLHESEQTVPGGVHLELTGEKVTECVGGRKQLLEDDLGQNYQTFCDPRLNVEQAVELAFEIADILTPCP